MRSPESALEEAIVYLREEVAPRAQAIDRDPEALRVALAGLAARDLMAMKRPQEFGGPELPEPLFRQFQQAVAQTSGALSFLQTQHQSAVAMLARGDNRALMEEYLPEMGDGRRYVGIGFSQLRRPGPPIMRAEPVDGGYRLEGHVPWVTGWDFYEEFLLGAQLPSGDSLLAPMPLRTGEGVQVSPPMDLAAMGSANTVSVDIQDYFLPDEKVAFVRPGNWLRNNDQFNIALQGHFALGCAQAGIDVVRQAAERRGAFVAEAADRLQEELEACRRETAEAQISVDEETTEARLRVRAWAIDLAVRCAHAAIAASSGAANSLDHPAQRIYREALVYTVSAQTTPIMEATLRRLTRDLG
ncbi:MAG: acyl-CoA dehydrogenase family protein [Fimbriimonas sp.]